MVTTNYDFGSPRNSLDCCCFFQKETLILARNFFLDVSTIYELLFTLSDTSRLDVLVLPFFTSLLNTLAEKLIYYKYRKWNEDFFFCLGITK